MQLVYFLNFEFYHEEYVIVAMHEEFNPNVLLNV